MVRNGLPLSVEPQARPTLALSADPVVGNEFRVGGDPHRTASQEWNATSTPQETKDVAIGWQKLGDLSALSSSREAFKTAFGKAYPEEKPGAVPVKAGVLFRFSKEMAVGDESSDPSKSDRLVKIGLVAGNYTYLPSIDPEYPHRRRVDWKVHAPRTQFSQPALYEIGSAITMFQISNNAEEFSPRSPELPSRLLMLML